MNKRSAFWDNYKGLLIACVVFGHFIASWAAQIPTGIAGTAFSFIYMFHMPAFVFCAGYWSNTESACSKKSIVKLLLLYFISNTAMMLYYYFVKGTPMGLLTPYVHNWFLLSLITWRLTAKHISGIKGIIPIALVGGLLVGFWSEFSNSLSIVRTVAFYGFFLMGYKLNKEKVQQFIENRKKYMLIIGWLVAIIGAGVLFLLVRKLGFTEAMLVMQPYASKRQVIYRALMFAVSAAVIATLFFVVPNCNIPILTKLGKNSLFIYLAHRFVTLVFVALFPNYSKIHLVYAVAATAVTLLVLGWDPINKLFHKAVDWLTEAVVEHSGRAGKIALYSLLALILLIGSVPLQQAVLNKVKTEPVQQSQAVDVGAVTQDAVVISFIGDMILLKEQVESAYDAETEQYDFAPMFEYVEPYLQSADLAIGVMEGPFAGAEAGYSTGNFDDGYKLLLNYPDAFATAIKNAGIDLVTTANNHVTDMDVEGAYRTLDVLDAAGLQHTGSYRNQEEKDRVQIVNVDGIDIAVLSYTFWAGTYTPEELHEQYPHLTSWIPFDDNPYYEELLNEVKDDFAAAKAANADLILVLPHMGTQFSHETDDMQNKWNKIYADLGADIILGDHSHAVQPIEYVGDTLVVNCPGNFANSYISYNGDAGAIVEVYIDRQTQKPVASSVIPLYTQEMRKGFYRALPVYEVLSDRALYEQMPSRDLERIREVQSLVTTVMVGKEISVDDAQPRYYWANGSYRDYTHKIDYSQYSNKEVYQLLASSESVAFLGDSITKGTKNGGHPWYEPLTDYFQQLKVTNISEGSYTVRMLMDNMGDQIRGTKADTYVIAIGTNDIRYREEDFCAMDEQQYVERIDALVDIILSVNPQANIILIAPWMTLENDAVSRLDHAEKMEMIRAYTAALAAYGEEKGYCVVDANEYLVEFFVEHHNYLYTYDGIHPYAGKGTELYAAAVLLMSNEM